MSIEEAKELKVGDRIRFKATGNVAEVFAVYEKGIAVIAVSFKAGHSMFMDWRWFEELDLEKL